MRTNIATVTAASALLLATPALAEERSFDYSGFDSVSVSAGIRTILVHDGDTTVQASAKGRNGLRTLDIQQRGRQLVVSRETSWSLFGLFRRDPEIVVTIAMPELVDVSVSSGASVRLGEFSESTLSIDVSSGANVTATQVEVDRLSLDASSGASLDISGECQQVSASASSGAAIGAGDLNCETVGLDSSSGASIRAQANGDLSVSASSGASVLVLGQPTNVDQSSSGGATVTIRAR